MINEALNGKLKECIALGNNYSRRIIKCNTNSNTKQKKELPKS